MRRGEQFGYISFMRLGTVWSSPPRLYLPYSQV